MSELPPAENDTATDETHEAMKRLQTDLEEVRTILGAWYRHRDSDRVSVQELRNSEYAVACQILLRAHTSVHWLGRELFVTIPEDEGEPIRSASLAKGAYDSIDTHATRPLEPGSTLVLKSERVLTNYIRQEKHTYFGDYHRYLMVSDIAEAVGRGGILGLRERPEDPAHRE